MLKSTLSVSKVLPNVNKRSECNKILVDSAAQEIEVIGQELRYKF